jgi:hypothetical protein
MPTIPCAAQTVPLLPPLTPHERSIQVRLGVFRDPMSDSMNGSKSLEKKILFIHIFKKVVKA